MTCGGTPQLNMIEAARLSIVLRISSGPLRNGTVVGSLPSVTWTDVSTPKSPGSPHRTDHVLDVGHRWLRRECSRRESGSAPIPLDRVESRLLAESVQLLDCFEAVCGGVSN